MSKRLRLVSASGEKRGLRSAAIGAFVSSNFQIVDQKDDGCLIRFGNVLATDGSCIEVIMRGLDRTKLEAFLGLYLEDNKTPGCIKAGTALPWPALVNLLYGDPPGTPEMRHVTLRKQRVEAAAELLGIAIAEIGETPLRDEAVMTEGDAKMLEWCKDRLYERAAAEGKSGSALAAQFKEITEAASQCSDTLSALRQIRKICVGGSEPLSPERLSEVNGELANLLHRAWSWKDSVDYGGSCAIWEASPDLALEAYLSKIQAVLDAEAARKLCRDKHEELLENIFLELDKGRIVKSTPPLCGLCRQKVAGRVNQHAREADRLMEEMAEKEKDRARHRRMQKRMQNLLHSMRVNLNDGRGSETTPSLTEGKLQGVRTPKAPTDLMLLHCPALISRSTPRSSSYQQSLFYSNSEM